MAFYKNIFFSFCFLVMYSWKVLRQFGSSRFLRYPASETEENKNLLLLSARIIMFLPTYLLYNIKLSKHDFIHTYFSFLLHSFRQLKSSVLS